MEEFYDPSSGFLEENPMLVDPFLLPTDQRTTMTAFGDGDHPFLGDGHVSLDNPLPHFPDSPFAGFCSPYDSELLFDFHHCLPVVEPDCPVADSFEKKSLMGEPGMGSPELPASNLGRKKGQPSKNLMAERRRRKRLHDRLSLLRSIVPKISKMDRMSILGDTISYVKELFGRINQLEQGTSKPTTTDHILELLKDSRPNDTPVRNSPKFHVERRNKETAIEIRCVGKPGILLTAMSSLEALGLEVEHCVANCFNDFVMRASCSEVPWDGKTIQVYSEDVIKQGLSGSAGYGGKCL